MLNFKSIFIFLIFGLQFQALASEAPENVLEKPGTIVRPLDNLGRPDHSKNYWKVDQKGDLIKFKAGTNRRTTKGQNYRIEGNKAKPIDHLGRIDHTKKPIKIGN